MRAHGIHAQNETAPSAEAAWRFRRQRTARRKGLALMHFEPDSLSEAAFELHSSRLGASAGASRYREPRRRPFRRAKLTACRKSGAYVSAVSRLVKGNTAFPAPRRRVCVTPPPPTRAWTQTPCCIARFRRDLQGSCATLGCNYGWRPRVPGPGPVRRAGMPQPTVSARTVPFRDDRAPAQRRWLSGPVWFKWPKWLAAVNSPFRRPNTCSCRRHRSRIALQMSGRVRSASS